MDRAASRRYAVARSFWRRTTRLSLALLLALLGLQVAPGPCAAQGTEGERASAPDVPRRTVLRFLTEGDFPPFNFYDEEGVLTGLNVDLARAICLELSAACDIRVRPWNELLPALKRGDADAVIAAHAVTPMALAEVDFSDRYFHTPGRFAARRETEQFEVSPEGLEGKRIAVAKGTAHEAYLRTFFHDSTIETYENPDLARDALQQGKVDVLFDDGISLAFWLNGTASRACCEFRGGPYLEPRFFGDGIAIAVPRSDPQIRLLINTALRRVRDNGRLEELVQRYFPFRIY